MCIFKFSKKHHLVCFFKPFELRGHRQCPHKTPSNCNTSVIPMLLNKFCPRKPQKPVHTHTHTHKRVLGAGLGMHPFHPLPSLLNVFESESEIGNNSVHKKGTLSRETACDHRSPNIPRPHFCCCRFNFDDESLQLMKVKNPVSQNIRIFTFEFH